MCYTFSFHSLFAGVAKSTFGTLFENTELWCGTRQQELRVGCVRPGRWVVIFRLFFSFYTISAIKHISFVGRMPYTTLKVTVRGSHTYAYKQTSLLNDIFFCNRILIVCEVLQSLFIKVHHRGVFFSYAPWKNLNKMLFCNCNTLTSSCKNNTNNCTDPDEMFIYKHTTIYMCITSG